MATKKRVVKYDSVTLERLIGVLFRKKVINEQDVNEIYFGEMAWKWM